MFIQIKSIKIEDNFFFDILKSTNDIRKGMINNGTNCIILLKDASLFDE